MPELLRRERQGVIFVNRLAVQVSPTSPQIGSASIEGADALVILTEWDQFRALDLDRVKAVMKSPVIIDLRNIYRPDDMRGRGFTYASIGRA